MRIALYEPPEHQRIGGLEVAMRSLEQHLTAAGITWSLNPTLEDLNATRPSLVHFNGLWQRNYPTVAAWCRRENVPYVVSPHGMLEPWAFHTKRWKKWPYFYLIERGFLRYAARLISTGAQEQHNLHRYTGHKQIAVVPLAMSTDHGVDYRAARAHLGYGDGERVLLFLSRIHPKKGLQLLLEALHRMGPHLKGVRLVIVGDGDEPFQGQMRARSEALTPFCTVDWQGAVWGSDKWVFVQAADLFCLPTYSENFGIAVLEALQVGTPVLTTHTTPWSFLNDWGAGIVTDPEIPPIQSALERFLNGFSWSADDRVALAERTREQFSPEKVTRLYVALYDDVLSGRTTDNHQANVATESWSQESPKPLASI